MRADAGPHSSRFIVIDRDPGGARQIVEACRQSAGAHADICHLDRGMAALNAIRDGGAQVIVADIGSIGDIHKDIEQAVRQLARAAKGALLVVTSDGASVSATVEAMRGGAHDFVAKPLHGKAFAARMEELCLRHGKAHAVATEICTPVAGLDFEEFVGQSNQMRYVFEQIERIAPSSAPVFITGESGTGKELCARALHRRSSRGKRPFISINCGAIPAGLMESELFGVVRGAYSGAVEDRKGAVELAAGGTLFLDEIGELELSLQTKLLRFLQTGAISRIGDGIERPMDVRVVCATNRNPMHLISEKRFREDLFYRLHVLPIHLPPLRQRPSDILPLANHFAVEYAREEAKHFKRLSAAAADLIVARDWPGNVRQLQNLIRRVVVMFDGHDIEAGMLAAADIEQIGGHAPVHVRTDQRERSQPEPILPMWRQEQRIIETALDTFNGNIALAAAALEISPSTIYRKRQSWAEMEMCQAGAA